MIDGQMDITVALGMKTNISCMCPILYHIKEEGI